MVQIHKTYQKKMETLDELLIQGVSFYGADDNLNTNDITIQAIIIKLFEKFPLIRKALLLDIEAACKGDPAVTGKINIIRDYPGFQAVLVYRVAHELYLLGAKSYARSLTEYTHSITDIDIHPGAQIGLYFFIDHGIGVVIGETTIIGDWVRIYQQVTLGAMSLSKEEI